jgi:hypothetical protein
MMDVKKKIEWVRLTVAAVVSPVVPILALATTMWRVSGSKAWFPLIFTFGYLFFCLVGLPVIAILIRERALKSCLLAGGTVTVLPILLLSVFSLPFASRVYEGRMLLDLLILFITGILGGLLFWIIAFAGTKREPK